MNEKITKAKARMVLRHPFFASLLLGCSITEDATLKPPTMATNGKDIWVHPSCAEKWSVEECMFVLAHETMHIAMMHPWRRTTRDPRKWNRATDYAINGILVDSGMDMPKEGLHDKQYDGMTAEAIYARLPDEPEGPEGGEGGDQFDDCRDAPGTEAERQQGEAEAKIRVKQAANAAKAQGSLPSALGKLVDEVLAPKIDWKDELRRFMTAVLKNDQSWARGQRRFMAQGLYLPSLHSPGMGRVVVGIDTSGSIYDRAPEFLNEVQAICEECKPESITVIQCDAKVQRVDEYAPGDPMVCDVAGGGGTDMREVYAAITEPPAVFILLTDGETPWPDVAPDYPCLTVTTSEPCPFGDTVVLT